jgi:hypothetical protein
MMFCLHATDPTLKINTLALLALVPETLKLSIKQKKTEVTVHFDWRTG